MSDRDTRLLARMLDALGTAENDTEIAQMVRQVRRIGGNDFFKAKGQQRQETAVSLADNRIHVRQKLHLLATLFDQVMVVDPLVAAIVQRFQRALAVEGMLSVDDLRGGIAVLAIILRDQLKLNGELRTRVRVLEQNQQTDGVFASAFAATYASMNAATQARPRPTTVEDTRRLMEMLRDFQRQGGKI